MDVIVVFNELFEYDNKKIQFLINVNLISFQLFICNHIVLYRLLLKC